MEFAAPDPWKAIKRDTGSKTRRPITVAIAYVGATGPTLLNLRHGDTLICDASPTAIRAGMTSAEALKSIVNRRVSIYSVAGLHAKVILGSRWVWVGSANASTSSQEDLFEASVRITDSAIRQSVRTWMDSLRTEDAVLTRRDVDALLKIPVTRRAGLPHRRRLPTELPDESQRLWLAVIDDYATRATERAAEQLRADVRRTTRRRGIAGKLSWFAWNDDSCPFAEGSWVIRVSRGHPSRPGQVVRVSNPKADTYIVWTAEVSTFRRPLKAELLQACSVSSEQLTDREMFRVPPARRKGVIDLYR